MCRRAHFTRTPFFLESASGDSTIKRRAYNSSLGRSLSGLWELPNTLRTYGGSPARCHMLTRTCKSSVEGTFPSSTNQWLSHAVLNRFVGENSQSTIPPVQRVSAEVYLSNSANLQQHERVPKGSSPESTMSPGNIEVTIPSVHYLLNVTPRLLSLDSSLVMSHSGDHRADVHVLKSTKVDERIH